MKNKFFILLAVFNLLFFSFINAQQKMTPEFLWKLGRVSDPKLSPDGKEVLYNVRVYNLSANKGNFDIWKVNFQNSLATQLTKDSTNETSAKFYGQIPGFS